MSFTKTLEKVGKQYDDEFNDCYNKNMEVLKKSFLPYATYNDKREVAIGLSNMNLVLNNLVLTPLFDELHRMFWEED